MEHIENEDRKFVNDADQAAYECVKVIASDWLAIVEAFLDAFYSPQEIEDILRPLLGKEAKFRFIRSACEFLYRERNEAANQASQEAFNNLPFMRWAKS